MKHPALPLVSRKARLARALRPSPVTHLTKPIDDLVVADAVTRERNIRAVTRHFALSMRKSGKAFVRSDRVLVAKAIDIMSKQSPTLVGTNPITAMRTVAAEEIGERGTFDANALANAAGSYFMGKFALPESEFRLTNGRVDVLGIEKAL